MINAAIVGLGWWGKVLVQSVQNKSDKIRFTAGAVRTPSKVADFAEAQRKFIELHHELANLDEQTLATAMWPQTTLKDIMGRVELQGKTTKQQQVLLHELYERLAGEAEARMTQSRQSMTPEERQLVGIWRKITLVDLE